MRIALLQPCYWPEVRRGSERLVHDLGAALAGRGHDVTLITSHPAPARTDEEDGILVVRTRRPPRFPPLRWYEDHLDSLPAAVWRLLRGRYDLAHAFQPGYAWGAVRARRLGSPPVVFSFHGIPERRYLVQRRYRLEMLQTTVGGAARVTVLSEAAREVFRRYLLRDPDVLPGGVVARDFDVSIGRAAQPTIICAASLGDPRKRGELLLEAYARLRERRPEVRLWLVRSRDPFLSHLSLDLPEGAEWVDGDETGELARRYASAHLSVLPSVGEAFGLVVAESLAAGTPAVAARGSAPGELVEEGVTGELFEQDDPVSLAEALARGLALGEHEPRAVAEACRAAVAAYEWESLVGEYERLYESVLEGGRG